MYDEVGYLNSFLKQVIVKVDFASPLLQLEKGVPSKLVKAVVKDFPIIEPSEMIAHELSIQADGVHTKQTTTKQWNYFGRDRDRKLTLAPACIFVLYETYNTFDETKEQFSAVIDALAKAYPDTQASRFGLRYINEINLQLNDPTQWGDYVAPALIESRNFFGADEAITRLMGITELRYEDVDVRFQFGMPNPDYPAKVKRPLFVLDIDASVTQAYELAEVATHMDRAHQRIQALYERSITNALREKMNARSV